MAAIEGQIETLKSIKSILAENGISRFGSIADINNFAKNYDSEKSRILAEEEKAFDEELERTELDLRAKKEALLGLEKKELDRIELQIVNQGAVVEKLRLKKSQNLIGIILYAIPFSISNSKHSRLTRKKLEIVKNRTQLVRSEVEKLQSKLEYEYENKEEIVSSRMAPKHKELRRIKGIVDDLGALVAGAVGEDKVVKEIRKLPDGFTLFNDYSLKFSPPIYNKKEGDRIYSIQVDHLLVTDSGIFLLETKNWSRKSVERLDLRSPVSQIMRSSYALFVTINNEIREGTPLLKRHHWGDKQIPIRSLIVMTNEKPKDSFQYVKVKTLKELNGYLSHFDPIFDEGELQRITERVRFLLKSN